jgi:hypothetical protein
VVAGAVAMLGPSPTGLSGMRGKPQRRLGDGAAQAGLCVQGQAGPTLGVGRQGRWVTMGQVTEEAETGEWRPSVGLSTFTKS